MLNKPLRRLYPNSVDATIVGNHGQLQLRFPLLFILFIFIILIILSFLILIFILSLIITAERS